MSSIGLPNVERAVPRASGLEGVVVADTRLSHVDGERGELSIAGSRVEDLALAEPGHFETVVERLLALGAGEASLGPPQGQKLVERLAQARLSAFVRVPQLGPALSLPNA